MGRQYDQSKNWHYYLTRPFNLFGASLWHQWYCSAETRAVIGTRMTDVLLVEESRDVFRQYRTIYELWKFVAHIGWNFLIFHPKRANELLEIGVNLNQQVREFVGNRNGIFEDLEDAVIFYNRLTLHSTIIPYILFELTRWLKAGFKKVKQGCEQLRSQSYYLQFYSEIIVPLALARLKTSGVNNPELALTVITYDELLTDKFSEIETRLRARNEGQFFLYQNLSGKETIFLTPSPGAIIEKLEGTSIDSRMKYVRGKTAYPGRITGFAKVVLSSADWTKFNTKDILVAPSTNPSLMALVIKAAAIVTNEGGILSHAAIVSRELKKPCIIGTKIATQVFKDDDLVEVDAGRGIARKL